VKRTEPDSSWPVAIVGIGGIFPGATSLESFWATIESGRSAARDVPAGRWILPPEQAYRDEIPHADAVYSRKGCFLDPIEAPTGTDVDTALLDGLDPVFHVAARAAQAALADYTENRDPLDEDERERVGVVIGNIALPTEKSSALAVETLGRTLEEAVVGTTSDVPQTDPLNRYVAGLPGGLLARAFGLGGGSLTLDAACASSLYALQFAVRELQAGRVDAMLTGGVSRPDCLYTQMGFSQLRALSPSGRCAPFDEKGDGLVVGEGAGIFVLKRLDDAVAAGDKIYAVVRGIGLSNDVGGRLLAPDSEGQLRAMRTAYEEAGWSPTAVDLIECHATGTPVGDAVEFGSLRNLWDGDSWRRGQCVLGSVKSNVGHLLTAAGAAGLMKVLLAMRHRTLPPTANFERPAPHLDFEDSPFQVLSAARAWSRRPDQAPLRAAVSAFGFGGINAHVLIEEWRETPSRVETSPVAETRTERQPIAIVGRGAHFGSWEDIPALAARTLDPTRNSVNRAAPQWGGSEVSGWYGAMGQPREASRGFTIDEIRLPLDRFRIPPKELAEMLPQQLLILQVARAAIEETHLSRELARRTGVFIGIGLDLNTTNFHLRWWLKTQADAWARRLGRVLPDDELDAWLQSLRDAAWPALTANRTMGALGGIVASRIAREFHLGGPSFTISSEETSGLRALEIAVRALQRGEVERAVVGAVDLAGDVRSFLGTHATRPYSASGQVRPFASDADGTVLGEGAAAFVLKRLDEAIADGDPIHGIIEGVGSATDGGVDRAPSGWAYATAVERALKDAGVEPESISYIETHGSGTPPEDTAELAGLLATYGARPRSQACALGAVKPVLGHTGAASGLAGLLRATLAMEHELLPGAEARSVARPELNERRDAFLLPAQTQYWLRDRLTGPRRAGLSAMSIDGNCVHVILRAADPESKPTASAEPIREAGEGLLWVEGDDNEELRVGLSQLLRQSESTFPLEELARETWRTRRREPGALAMAFVARDRAELRDHIERGQRLLSSDPVQRNAANARQDGQFADERFFYSPEPLGPRGELAFVYPGSGNHYAGMGRALSARFPEVLARQDDKTDFLRSQLCGDLFWNTEAPAELEASHPVLLLSQVAFGIFVTDILDAFGVRPQAALGYSLGETTALFSLGAWTARDVMFQRMMASPLFATELAGPCEAARRTWCLPPHEDVDWVAGIIDRPADAIRDLLRGRSRVYLLIINSPSECVIGGQRAAVEEVARASGGTWLPFSSSSAVHCEVVEPVKEHYRQLHRLDTTPPPNVRFYSGARARSYDLSAEAAADAIVAQAVHGIDFPRLISRAYDDGVRSFVEIGPRGSCTRHITRTLEARPALATAVCVPGAEEVTQLLKVLAQLLAERVPVDLTPLYGAPGVQLPQVEPEAIRSVRVRVGVEPFAVPQLPPEHVTVETSSPPLLAQAAAPTRPSRPPLQPTANVPPAPEVAESAVVESRPSATVFSKAAAAGAVPPTGKSPVADVVPPDVVPPEIVSAMAVAPPTTTGSQGAITHQCAATYQAQARAEEAFLTLDSERRRLLAEQLRFQMEMTPVWAGAFDVPQQSASTEALAPAALPQPSPSPTTSSPAPISQRVAANVRPALLDRALCLEFAIGSIARVLGPEFAEIDSHPTRVRLPDEPLMLVDRITELEGEPRSLSSGRVVTEHDVLPGAWYLDNDRLPTCIAVEAGQADLFLSAYLGIDFETKGHAVYRLLDAKVTFHRPLPRAGEIVRYDIRIERFFRQAETFLFRFRFDSTVNGEPLLTMRNGCAGFFTDAELAAGAGIIQTPLDLQPKPGVLPADWRELVPMEIESYDAVALDALREGRLADSFGEQFKGLSLKRPVRLPSGTLRLIDRVTHLDPAGGRFGLGVVRAETDIPPDAWFLTCHFVDDQVMPGTLMYECCLHTLRVFLLRMGWVGEEDEVVFEPVPGIGSTLKCRGQVTATTRVATYEVTPKEFGFRPEPYVLADAIMYADGKPIVEIRDMSVRLSGLTRERLETIWQEREPTQRAPAPRFDSDRILAFAVGKPSEAFGEAYRIFDEDRVIARLPGPPYQFLDRITEISAEPWKLVAGGEIEAEYDVPVDAWYFAANRQRPIPFGVLLEVALQPCGWLAAYVGSALTSETDLSFRNLGGQSTQHALVTPETGTLTTRVKLTRVSTSGGMIIQNYDLDVRAGTQTIYRGDTYFGFFSKAALADQVGVRDAALYEPGLTELEESEGFPFPRNAPMPDDRFRMMDDVEVYAPNGGPRGLGFLRAVKQVDPDEWFFKAHFYQDPVWPGSLGLEAFLQLLKLAALRRWGTDHSPENVTFAAVAVGEPHRWIYRGQVIPTNHRVTVEAVITEVDDARELLKGAGFLSVDGRVIYEMHDFAVGLR
jgi:acyl transferase domain-containing protein/3-hydroxymyristoyl/3-hydroxydecanoyl-(acyl carrier protein) dehydratase